MLTLVVPGDQTQCQLGKPLIVEGNVVVAGQSGWEPSCQSGGTGVYAFTIRWDGTGLVAPAVKLENPDGARGVSLALNEGILVVGAPDAKNDAGITTGAVYVYERRGLDSWRYTAKLVASDGADGDGFGESVAVDSGSHIVVVGTRRHGHESERGVVYVFSYGQQMASISAPDEVQGTFGRIVTICGNRIFVSAHNGNLIYVYQHDRYDTVEPWKLVARMGNLANFDDVLVAGTERFLVTSAGFIFELVRDMTHSYKQPFPISTALGKPSSMATDGKSILFGWTPLNLAYVYVYNWYDLPGPNGWRRVLVLEPTHSADPWSGESGAVSPLQFGAAVDVSGDWLVVGAPWYSSAGSTRSGAVYVYRLSQAGIK